jgi:flagellar hook-associated protein 2
MDVDQLVKDLMKARRANYDKMYQAKTRLEWKKSDMNAIYKKVTEFRTSLFNYKMQSTLTPKTVSSSDSTYVTAAANADAVNVSHTIHVSQLASAAMTSSSAALGSVAGAANLSAQFGGTFSGTREFTITNGSQSGTVSIDTSTETVYDLVSKINALGIDVSANYDSTVDRFYLSTTNTGKTASLNIGGADASWFTDTFDLTGGATGTNANFTLDGSTYDDTANITKNTFTIAGVTYSLKNTMADGVNASLSVSNDVDKAVTVVKNLVDSYNKLITEISSELTETYYKDLPPLTSADKEDMDDSEIKTYTEKSKSGMLRRDPTLRTMLDQIRGDFANVVSGVSGKYNSAASIGITTGQYFDSDGAATGEQQLSGFLYLNEDKLRSALQEDPNAVFKVFGTDGATHDADGVAVRMYDSLKSSIDKIKTDAGIISSPYDQSNWGKKIADYEKLMDSMEDRLEMIEDRYYKQFNAMEQAISQMNKQSAWLAQSFGTNSSNS